ncbi:MAG: fibronectin type III domain-containing protein [Marinifilaceae bacterium]
MKNNFKSFLISLPLLCLTLLFTQCNNDSDVLSTGGEINIGVELPTGGTFDKEVSGVRLTPGLRELTVEWNAPEGDVSYYIVEWKGVESKSTQEENGEVSGPIDATLYSQAVPKTQTSYVIERLYNTTYNVTVKCVSDNMEKSLGTTEVGAPTPDETAPAEVTGVIVAPVASSALLTWVNPTDDDLDRVMLRVYQVDEETNEETDILVIKNLQYFHDTQLVTKLSEVTEYHYEFKTQDYIGNTSEGVKGTFKTFREALLPNKGVWEVVDFSSEERSGEGAGQGHAEFAIDEDDSKFWHSKWTNGGSSIPHYIVIDFKQLIKPTVVTVFKRQTGTAGQSLIKLEGCVDEPTPTTEWYDLGTHSIDGVSQEGQDCSITNIQDVRYIKLSVMASGNGHAMIRNIMVRSLVD